MIIVVILFAASSLVVLALMVAINQAENGNTKLHEFLFGKEEE